MKHLRNQFEYLRNIIILPSESLTSRPMCDKKSPMLPRFLLFSAMAVFLFYGCGSKNYPPSDSMSDSLKSDGNPDINFVDRKNVHDRHDDIKSSFRTLNPQNQGWKTYYEFEEVFDEFPDVVPESEREIPVVYNAKVAEQISYFQNRGRRSFGIWLARSGKYVPSMKKILQQKGMPTDLVYMSMIENYNQP